MKTRDVMTHGVVSVEPEASVADLIGLMAKHGISGVPVIASNRSLVGIVTEGDLLRRAELDTEKPRLWLASLLYDRSRIAADYVKARTRCVADVMTREVHTVPDDAPLAAAVTLMEKHRINRLPVVHGDEVVGIISRSNLIQALGDVLMGAETVSATDREIRKALGRAIHDLPWTARRPYATVRAGVVDLYWDGLTSDWERQALRVAAQTVRGVKEVRDRFIRRL